MSRNTRFIASRDRCRMDRLFVLFLIIANLWASSVQAKAKMKRIVWLQELRPCQSEPGQARLNGSFRYTGHGTFQVSLDAFTPRKLSHLYLFVDLKKCPTMQVSDDCEDMMSFPAGDQCQSDAYFKYLYDQFQPPVACPVLGLYQAKNVFLETDHLSPFFRGVTEEEWLHAHVNVYSDAKRRSKKIVCLMGTLTMKNVRVKEENNRNKKQ